MPTVFYIFLENDQKEKSYRPLGNAQTTLLGNIPITDVTRITIPTFFKFVSLYKIIFNTVRHRDHLSPIL